MMNWAFCFVVAVMLFVGGTIVVCAAMFFAVRPRLLDGAALSAVVGATWLWVDFIAPAGRAMEDDPERS